jgi:hypothetical protein
MQVTRYHEYLIKPLKAFIKLLSFFNKNAVNMTFFSSELNVLLLLSQDIVRELRNESAKEKRRNQKRRIS